MIGVVEVKVVEVMAVLMELEVVLEVMVLCFFFFFWC